MYGNLHPWNKDRLLGQKPPLKPEEIWRFGFVCNWQAGSETWPCSTWRWTASLSAWIKGAQLDSADYLFRGRCLDAHLSRRQYARIFKAWVRCIGLDPSRYGTHSLRRTKATLIYRRTKNIRAIQLLLGHTRLESTVRYLGIEVDDALEISEQVEI